MRLSHPIENFEWKENISQLFAVAYHRYHKKFGTDGHNGIDIIKRDRKRGYGSKIYTAHQNEAVCVKVFTDFPDKTKGTGVYLQEELDNGDILETVYWHLADVLVRVGDTIKPRTIIGLMGNTGWVSPRPTKAFPYKGTHLHFSTRLYIKGRKITIDPTPLLFKEGEKLPIKFNRMLILGSTGDQVSWLQTCLKLSGFAEDYEPVGIFGPKTLRDVRKLQTKIGLSPVGIVGPKTRRHLNSKYS